MEQQLARVGNVNLRNLGLPFASIAVVGVFGQSRLANEATDVTDEHAVLIGHVHGSLLQESGSSMRDHAVTLHFSETESTISGSAFGWLSCQDLDGASASRVHLVSDQVL